VIKRQTAVFLQSKLVISGMEAAYFSFNRSSQSSSLSSLQTNNVVEKQCSSHEFTVSSLNPKAFESSWVIGIVETDLQHSL